MNIYEKAILAAATSTAGVLLGPIALTMWHYGGAPAPLYEISESGLAFLRTVLSQQMALVLCGAAFGYVTRRKRHELRIWVRVIGYASAGLLMFAGTLAAVVM